METSAAQILLYALIMATALPAGLLLAWLCSDELAGGKKWFRLIIYSCFALALAFLLFWRNPPAILALAYLIIVSALSLFRNKLKIF